MPPEIPRSKSPASLVYNKGHRAEEYTRCIKRAEIKEPTKKIEKREVLGHSQYIELMGRRGVGRGRVVVEMRGETTRNRKGRWTAEAEEGKRGERTTQTFRVGDLNCTRRYKRMVLIEDMRRRVWQKSLSESASGGGSTGELGYGWHRMDNLRP